MDKNNIHAEHRKRVRERYIREGIDNFAAHEIIELLLHYSKKYSDTNKEAHGLIKKIGSYSGVFDADIAELSSVFGVGEESATFLKFIKAVCDLYSNEKREKGTFFRSVQSIVGYCNERYRNITEETYSVMLFDVSDRILGFERLSVSSWEDGEKIVEELGKYVFGYNASSFVLVRNAVDGNITPSRGEMSICKGISKFYKSFNRVMSEYIILGDGRYIPVCKYLSEHT